MKLLATKELSPYEEITAEILAAQRTHQGFQTNGATGDDTSPGVVTMERRISVPHGEVLQAKIVRLFDDTPESGYFGILETVELVSRDLF
jgi:hypothetical protein